MGKWTRALGTTKGKKLPTWSNQSPRQDNTCPSTNWSVSSQGSYLNSRALPPRTGTVRQPSLWIISDGWVTRTFNSTLPLMRRLKKVHWVLQQKKRSDNRPLPRQKWNIGRQLIHPVSTRTRVNYLLLWSQCKLTQRNSINKDKRSTGTS